MPDIFLVAIVEVDKADRIICQAQGCGHGVYRRIHVVLVDKQFTLLGCDCFQRLYGVGKKAYTPYYHWSDGRRLTDEERLQLVENTTEFIEQLEAERLQLEQDVIKLQAAPLPSQPAPSKERTEINRPGRVYGSYEGASALYEGSAILRWKWYLDHATAADILASHKANSPSNQILAAVTATYVKKDFTTPYSFALEVELSHFFPKKYTMRLLHELSLIVQN